MIPTCPHANDCRINAKPAGCGWSGKLSGGVPFWPCCPHLPEVEMSTARRSALVLTEYHGIRAEDVRARIAELEKDK